MFKKIKAFLERFDDKHRTVLGNLTAYWHGVFWNNVNQAELLLTRLIDEDIKSGLLDGQLRVVKSITHTAFFAKRMSDQWSLELQICIALHQSKVILRFIVDDFASRELEMDPFWMERLEAFDRTSCNAEKCLTIEDKERLHRAKEIIHTQVAQSIAAPIGVEVTLRHPADYT